MYDAAGQKLSVTHQTAVAGVIIPMTGVMTPLSPAQILQTFKTDYCGNVIYENGAVSRILTEEGYITFNGTTPVYHYYLKDHQGNNRVVLNQDGTVEQVNHYYPFGGLMGESTAGGVQPYKYNGKELDRMHGLDLFDYGARHYDAAIGRWWTMDPLAGKYYEMSPYNYCANSPVRFIDPNGMWYEDPPQRNNFWSGFNNLIEQFFFGKMNNPPKELQGKNLAKFQLQELQQGAQRAKAAGDYISSVNEGITAIHPLGSTMKAVANIATGQEVKKEDISYSLMEITPVTYVGKGVKWGSTFILRAERTEQLLLTAGKLHIHHILPQQFRKWFANQGINNIDDYGVVISSQTHLKGVHGNGIGNLPGRWNTEWSDFIKANPKATPSEIFHHAEGLLDKYGLSHLPYVSYK